MRLWFVVLALLCTFTIKTVEAQEVPISEDEMVNLINSSFKDYKLYGSKDIPDKDLHTFDFNGDDTAEWVVVPETACGETKNCTFFVMQYDKKKGWKLLLMADGKVTNLTPWGFVVAPRKTKGYSDLISVFDMGPDNNANRLLERHVWVWNGKKYEEFTGSNYPPEGAKDDMKALLAQVDQLKFQKMSGPKKRAVVKKKKGPKVDVFTMPTD